MINLFADPTLQGYAWLVAALLLLLSEIGAPGLFYFLSFSAGATGASMAAFLGADIYIQCLVGLAVAAITFFVMRVYVKPSTKPSHKTNLDALMHQEAVVIEPIEPRKTGRVKVKGEEWPAITETGYILHKGTVVMIMGLEGNKLIVR